MFLIFHWMQTTSEIIQQLIYPIVITLKYMLSQMNKGLISCMINTLKYKYISSTTIHLILQTKINLSVENFRNKQWNLKNIIVILLFKLL